MLAFFQRKWFEDLWGGGSLRLHISTVGQLIKAEINKALAVSAAATVCCSTNSRNGRKTFIFPRDLILQSTVITYRLNDESEIQNTTAQKRLIDHWHPPGVEGCRSECCVIGQLMPCYTLPPPLKTLPSSKINWRLRSCFSCQEILGVVRALRSE